MSSHRSSSGTNQELGGERRCRAKPREVGGGVGKVGRSGASVLWGGGGVSGRSHNSGWGEGTQKKKNTFFLGKTGESQ